MPWASSEMMSLFLATVAEPHPEDFIVTLMDQTGWYIAGRLLPRYTRLVLLPPLQPGLRIPANVTGESGDRDRCLPRGTA